MGEAPAKATEGLGLLPLTMRGGLATAVVEAEAVTLALASDVLVADMRELEPLALACARRVTGMVAH